MSDWRDVFHRPKKGTVEEWLAALAARLLNGVRLIVGGERGEPHRLIEVEAYYHSEDHADRFAHCDPIQLECGKWYFHRTRGTYRSGSFKGLDVTFGDGKAHAGFLFRGLELPDGTLIDGPSLLVDHLLASSLKRDVATLDLAIANRAVWDESNPLRLEPIVEEDRPIFTCSRVGLSLKRMKPTPENLRFLLRPYRYLTEPKRTAKGKVLLVLALHRQGRSADEIRELTGCPAASIKRYVEEYAAGLKESDPSAYAGIDLGARELCRLHGIGAR